MATSIALRPAERRDIPTLTHIANAANAQSALHRRIARYQDEYPLSYHHWRLNIIRQRFATPDLRTIVAIDPATDEILGQASFAVEGPNTDLYKRWVGEADTWVNWLELRLVFAEKAWRRWTCDKAVDYTFLVEFMRAFLGDQRPQKPPCLHCHLIVVNPSTQARGVGSVLMHWAKQLAKEENLPIYLESNLEATGFYERIGFRRLEREMVVKSGDDGEGFRIPVFVWEGEGREGRWLVRDGSVEGEGGERWRWRDDLQLQ